jgi:hypothetical protein
MRIMDEEEGGPKKAKQKIKRNKQRTRRGIREERNRDKGKR